MDEVLAGIPGLSERLACRLLGWCRASLRYRARPRLRDERLKVLLPELARRAPREGYRRATDGVRAVLGQIGENTVHRLWKLLRLQVKPRKRRRTRRKPLPEALGLRANGLNHVWCLDFMKDWTIGGQTFRILSVVDEYTRECLVLVAARSFKAADVVAQLEWLGYERGLPVHVRSDNGPEFIAKDVARWAEAVHVELVRSAPGCPWHNPFSETFHSRARDEFTEGIAFGSLAEARVLCEVFRAWYNTARRHSSLGKQTPAAFAAKVRSEGLVLGQPGLVGYATA